MPQILIYDNILIIILTKNMAYKKKETGKLILQDGSEFSGFFFGYNGVTTGEVVFNTGMVGYPETLTDPSYSGQILTFTFPLIGNYGVPGDELDEYGLSKNFESDKIHVKGLIISDYSKVYSHWNSVQYLSDWLITNKIPALCGIDTRRLTKKLRTSGVMAGKIISDSADIDFNDFSKDNAVDLVSTKQVITYGSGKKKILLIDCGVKNNIIRSLLQRDTTIIKVPWDFDFFNSELKFDGIFISNGPGDPKQCVATINNIKEAMQKEIPIMGICLGNQILALASGADTYKLKFGHRSQNQPCMDMETKKCYITSQNHGYAIKTDTLKKDWQEWFININDNTNEGIKHKTKPFFSVQFHPEAMPGPVDTGFLFDKFVDLI